MRRYRMYQGRNVLNFGLGLVLALLWLLFFIFMKNGKTNCNLFPIVKDTYGLFPQENDMFQAIIRKMI